MQPSLEGNSKAVSRYSGVAAACAFGLAVLKLILFWTTGSLIIGFSAWDSFVDVLVSLLNRKVILFARQDADDNHPYGHGKAECIANLGQGALIIGGALYVFAEVVRDLLGLKSTGEVPFVPTWDLPLFFVGCAGVSFFVSWFLKRGSIKYRSPGLRGDAAHYESDVLMNLGSAAALGSMTFFRWNWIDSVVALATAGILGRTAFLLLKDSINELMDHDIGADIRNDVCSTVKNQYPMILDIHKFRGRKSGHRYFFDFHVTLPHELSFKKVHEIADGIEELLIAKYAADVIVHTDPSGVSTVLHRP